MPIAASIVPAEPALTEGAAVDNATAPPLLLMGPRLVIEPPLLISPAAMPEPAIILMPALPVFVILPTVIFPLLETVIPFPIEPVAFRLPRVTYAGSPVPVAEIVRAVI